MEGSQGKTESEKVELDEVRQRRLKYFQTAFKVNSSENQHEENDRRTQEPVPENSLKTNLEIQSRDVTVGLGITDQKVSCNPNDKQSSNKQSLQVFHDAGTSHAENVALSLNPQVFEKWTQDKTKNHADRPPKNPDEIICHVQGMYSKEKPASMGNISMQEKLPGREIASMEKSNYQLSKDWNSHIEDLFSKGSAELRDDVPRLSLKESQDYDSVSVFKSEADFNDLGLSTHRLESSWVDQESGDRLEKAREAILDEGLTQEMKNLLGETKYQEFVEKSLQDINDLYQNKTTETSPHLIKSLIEEQAAKKAAMPEKETNCEHVVHSKPNISSTEGEEKPMNNQNYESRSPKPRLNRPRKEPVHIQNHLVTKTIADMEKEGSKFVSSGVRNYEQVTIPRNVTYSADEIYRQAYGASQMPQGYPGGMNPVLMNTHFNQGVPYYPAMMGNVPMPPSPGFHQSMPPGPFMYPVQADPYTPRTPTTPSSPHPVYYNSYMVNPAMGNSYAHQGFGIPFNSPNYENHPFPNSFQIPHFVNDHTVHMHHPTPQYAVNSNFPQQHPGWGMFYPPHMEMVPHPPFEKKNDVRAPSSDRVHIPKEHQSTEESRDSLHQVRSSHKKIASQDILSDKADADLHDDGTGTSRHVEAIRQHHEQRRQMHEDKIHEARQLDKQNKFAQASLDRYFSSLAAGGHDIKTEDPVLSTKKEEPNDPNEDHFSSQNIDEETVVTVTSVVTATSVKAGGITDRLEELGVDLALVKPKGSSAESETMEDAEGKSKKKKVKVCPGCTAWNKEYMSWCADCGEILIGVEAVVAKKKKHVKVKKSHDKNQKNSMEPQLETVKNKTDNIQNDANISSPVLSNTKSSKDEKTPSPDSGWSSSEHCQNGVTADKSRSPPLIRSEREINDICEVINDPVIRGFIRSYFSRKSKAASGGTPESVQQEATNGDDKDQQGVPLLEPTTANEAHAALDVQAASDSFGAWLHENVKPKPEKRLNNKRHGEIDVEVFDIEESRQSRNSSHGVPPVPALNLVQSSDEEDVKRHAENKNQPVSYSIDSEDWSSYYDGQGQQRGGHSPPSNLHAMQNKNSFLSQILGSGAKSTKQQRPQSADLLERKRRQHAPSKVRESIEAPYYQRHWTKSSIAWGSYHPRELNTRSSCKGNAGMSAHRYQVSGSAENLLISPNAGDPRAIAVQSLKKVRPCSADLHKRKSQLNNRPSSSGPRRVAQNRQPEMSDREPVVDGVTPQDVPDTVTHRLSLEEKQAFDLASHRIGPPIAIQAYNKYMEMTPRIRDGDFSTWLCLPDEIWLHVFSYLSHNDLATCSRVCKQFCRIGIDESLWKYISVKKKAGICDEWLSQIALRHPVSLALIQLHGDNVSAIGLRELFRECSDSLQELNFSRCSRGALTGDSILLHASARCRNLTHVDASWCHVTDNGISAVSECAHRLQSLCMNGCQMLSDEGLETVVKKHGKSLRVLEMFGCFNLTPAGIRCLANNCTHLHTLNLGQCHRLTDSCIAQLSASLGRIEDFDLRGCKQIKDNCIRKIVRNCPRLKTVALANCPNISDAAMVEIATYLNDIRSLDVCGCRLITDQSIRTLANNCQRLMNLDISSTGCTHRSVLLLANYCNRNLETLKLNFLADVMESSLQKLAKHCKRLKTLHLYGCTSVRSITKLKQICPFLSVEM